MIVVNQDRTSIMETKNLWRYENTIYCDDYTLATYKNEDDASYVFEEVLKHFTNKEPYYLPQKDKVRN